MTRISKRPDDDQEYDPEARVVMTFRGPMKLKRAIVEAAEDTELTMSDWIRAVLEQAVDLHQQQVQRLLGEVTDDLEPDEPASVSDPHPSDPDYVERVEAEAARLRATMPPPPEPEQRRAHPLPRECPHLPSDRRGNLCTACGVRFGPPGGARVIASNPARRYTGRAG